MGHRIGGFADRYLVNRDFAWLWSGQALSSVGDFVFDTSLILWIATDLLRGEPWAPAAVAGLVLSALVAIMIVGPVAGVFVDRWSHRRTMLSSETIRGLLVAFVAALMFLPTSDLPTWVWLAILYAAVLGVNACGQFFNPARFATIGDIVVGEGDRTKAFGLSQATASTSAIIGPPIAAPLLFTLGIQWALLLNAATYLVSFVAIRAVRFPATDSSRGSRIRVSTWRREFTDGVRLFRTNRYLVALLGVAVMASLGTGAITPLLVFFIQKNLSTDPNRLGILTAAFGFGSVVGALSAGRLARWVGARALTWLGLLAAGALLAVFARQTSFPSALLVLFLTGVPVAALNAGISPQLLAVTPEGFRGRMIGVFTPVNTAASMVSLVSAGLIASTAMSTFHHSWAGVAWGPIDTIFTGSALLILAAGLLAYATLPPSERVANNPLEPEKAPTST